MVKSKLVCQKLLIASLRVCSIGLRRGKIKTLYCINNKDFKRMRTTHSMRTEQVPLKLFTEQHSFNTPISEYVIQISAITKLMNSDF